MKTYWPVLTSLWCKVCTMGGLNPPDFEVTQARAWEDPSLNLGGCCWEPTELAAGTVTGIRYRWENLKLP